MKTILSKIQLILLPCLLVAAPVGAQTNASLEAEASLTNASREAEASTTDLTALQKQKQQLEKDLESDRLRQQKDITSARFDTNRAIVHDLTWNSWVLFLVAIFFFGYLRDKRREGTIRLMIEKGTPITPELLDGLCRRRYVAPQAGDPRGYLRWGVPLTFVGIVLLLTIKGGGRVAGWIVLAVGVAQLILWSIDKRLSKDDQSK